MPARIVLETPRASDDTLEIAATFHPEPDRPQRMWWRIPLEWQASLAPTADVFARAFAFPMMIAGKDTRIEGTVSPSLLRNLETYMATWSTWFPDRYRPVQVTAAQEREAAPPPEPGQTIMPFSCGVDSSFTAFRHANRLARRRTRNLRAAIVIHGFGMKLERPQSAEIYQGILASAKSMLEPFNIRCIPVSTNFQALPTDWFQSHGSQLVAALSLFSGTFDTALIGNSVHCTGLDRHLGSHPYADLFLSSDNFQVVDDGAEFLRYQKIKQLAQWPAAMQHLRVCLNPQGNHLNCCRCEKCILSILAFRVAGVAHPPAFSYNPTDRDLATMRILKGAFPLNWMNLMKAIEQHGLQNTSWAKAVRRARRRNRLRDRWNRLRSPFIPIRNAFRKAFRGSTLSRKQESSRAPRE